MTAPKLPCERGRTSDPDFPYKPRARRIWRACGRCRALKVKCSNETPCQRCKDVGLMCVTTSRMRKTNKCKDGGEYTRMLESNLNALVATTQRLYGMVQGIEAWPYDKPECTSDGLPSAQSIAELLGILYESDNYHYMRPSLIYTSPAAITAMSASEPPVPATAAKREASRPVKSAPAGAVHPFETQNGAPASSIPSPRILPGSTAPLFEFDGQEDVDSMSCGETSSANTSTTLFGSGSPNFDLDWSLLDSAAFPLSFTSPCSENFPSLSISISKDPSAFNSSSSDFAEKILNNNNNNNNALPFPPLDAHLDHHHQHPSWESPGPDTDPFLRDEFEYPMPIPNMLLPLPSIAEANLEHNLLFGSGNPNTSAASSADAEDACPPERFRDFLKLESEVVKLRMSLAL